jgi:hypothetical protein
MFENRNLLEAGTLYLKASSRKNENLIEVFYGALWSQFGRARISTESSGDCLRI